MPKSALLGSIKACNLVVDTDRMAYVTINLNVSTSNVGHLNPDADQKHLLSTLWYRDLHSADITDG
jgi:hypothetical protein